MRGAAALAKNVAHHDRNHTTGNPKTARLLKCQVWRDYERLGRRKQQWPMPPMSARAPSRRQDVHILMMRALAAAVAGKLLAIEVIVTL